MKVPWGFPRGEAEYIAWFEADFFIEKLKLKRFAFSVRKGRYPRVFFEICGEIIRVGKTKRECDLSYRFIGVFEKSFGFFKSYLVYFCLERDISRFFENVSHIRFGIVQPF